MKLIIAEKPSVARDIASVLGSVQRRQGYLYANGYTVTYAVGHLVGLADADAYDRRYKTWKLQDLPILPEKFQLAVLEHGKSQYEVVARLLQDAEEVIVATDAGREGQLIYEYIARLAGYEGTAKRLWLSSMTPEAIRQAFSQLRDNREYQNLYAAAVCRSEADWLVGINATRCMTVQAGVKLPVGRVQTPTLAMIVGRDDAIANFVPVPYYEVVATFAVKEGTYTGKWTKDRQSRIDDVFAAEAIAAKVRDKTGSVTLVETKPKVEQPPQLFDLTSLQRRANQLLGYTADQTLKLVQALYETHKALTYPRTDSRYIGRDIVPTLPARLQAVGAAIPVLRPLVEQAHRSPGKRVVDDKKVTDHHAIIPTEKAPGALRPEERKIYELVAKQTLAALLPPAEWALTTIETNVDQEIFRTAGRVLAKEGWRSALGGQAAEESDRQQDEDSAAQLPRVEKGESARVERVDSVAKQTKPPAHFTEASLLAAMENAGKQVDDAELAEAMKERGLGTPATRAATIEKLKRDGLIATEKKRVVSTAKGRELIAAIPVAALTSPELTGEWEARLKQMERGMCDRDDFMRQIRDFARAAVTQLSVRRPAMTTPAANAIGSCPKCGQAIVETRKAFGCSAWRTGCDFTIWKEISGHKMTIPQVKALLAEGITKQLTFKSGRTGKSFEAQLHLANGKVEFQFAEKK